MLFGFKKMTGTLFGKMKKRGIGVWMTMSTVHLAKSHTGVKKKVCDSKHAEGLLLGDIL